MFISYNGLQQNTERVWDEWLEAAVSFASLSAGKPMQLAK